MKICFWFLSSNYYGMHNNSITVMLSLLLFMLSLLSRTFCNHFISSCVSIVNVPTHVISICLFLIFYSYSSYVLCNIHQMGVNICGIWWTFFLFRFASWIFRGESINNKRQTRVFTMPKLQPWINTVANRKIRQIIVKMKSQTVLQQCQ